ncbi:MAG: isocitrate lyase/phosphoenolpyruvate mutase family protein [Rhodospirillales bacterium]|jgi:methylisocitrate lyase|nr:isocitrate lyase/phosphoenolpyruvate mutase family protein [Rhodospirillales bacterium]
MRSSAERAAQLRARLREGLVMMPGAFNALSAKLIDRAGFEAVYLSGAVLANSVGGVPDIGLMTLTEARDHAERIARATDLPILMDADTGYGGADNAAHCVRVLEAVGVSGIHLEDQEFPKRCGHLDGKKLVPAEEFAAKIVAAARARSSPDFLIIARTDARGVVGFEEAVRRAKLYLEAGADGIFPEALTSAEELARFAKEVPALLLANMTEFGKTPLVPASDLAAMGYRIAIYPVTLQRLAMRTVAESLAVLRQEGTQARLVPQMQSRQELYDLLGYSPTAG